MAEPQIQYAKTSDGVNIAYYTMGAGKPLLVMSPLLFSHLTLEWGFPPLREWYVHLSRSRTLVRLDPRCNGLSERGVSFIGPGSDVLDVEAVVEHSGLAELDYIAHAGDCITAVEFAALHPDCVSRLVLLNPNVQGSDFFAGQMKAVQSLLEQDYELYCETFAHSILGWAKGPIAHEYAHYMAASTSQADLLRMFATLATYDARPYLHQVAAQTLVIVPPPQRRRFWYAERARELASGIPNARVMQIPFEQSMHFDTPRIRAAIDDFLGIAPPEARLEQGLPSGTAIILFADIADSTALTERLGDAAFRDKARELDEALRRAITSNGGQAIEGKLLGDGVLATFGAAREAIACAAAIHAAGSHAGLPLHVGIHAGDVLREEGNVYGGAVNIASRISGEAAAGETLVSGTVRELARTSAGVSFEDRGERELKGVSEPVRVWAVV